MRCIIIFFLYSAFLTQYVLHGVALEALWMRGEAWWMCGEEQWQCGGSVAANNTSLGIITRGQRPKMVATGKSNVLGGSEGMQGLGG